MTESRDQSWLVANFLRPISENVSTYVTVMSEQKVFHS